VQPFGSSQHFINELLFPKSDCVEQSYLFSGAYKASFELGRDGHYATNITLNNTLPRTTDICLDYARNYDRSCRLM
jgi:hypothetical protein